MKCQQQNITDLFIQIVTSNVNIVNNSFITLSQATNFSKKKKKKKKKEKNWTQLKISYRFNMTANMYVIYPMYNMYPM